MFYHCLGVHCVFLCSALQQFSFAAHSLLVLCGLRLRTALVADSLLVHVMTICINSVATTLRRLSKRVRELEMELTEIKKLFVLPRLQFRSRAHVLYFAWINLFHRNIIQLMSLEAVVAPHLLPMPRIQKLKRFRIRALPHAISCPMIRTKLPSSLRALLPLHRCHLPW